MTDETKDVKAHPAAGAVGAIGAAGDLGENAGGAERPPAPPAAPPAAPGLTLEPAKGPVIEVPPALGAKSSIVTATAEEQLVSALVNAGFGADESVKMAQAAIAEIAARKGK